MKLSVMVTASAPMSTMCVANSGPQIFLSRTHPSFMAKLFTMEVPEITGEHHQSSRLPAIQVPAPRLPSCHDASIDPVGACVGMRGSRVPLWANCRVKRSTSLWSPDAASFIVNALQPAEVPRLFSMKMLNVLKLSFRMTNYHLQSVVAVRTCAFASQLTGWDIDILTEDEESNVARRNSPSVLTLFMDALNVDEMVGQVLASWFSHLLKRLAMSSRAKSPPSMVSMRIRLAKSRGSTREYLDRIERTG